MGFTTLEQEVCLKLALLVDGVDVAPSACAEVGTKYGENIAWVFVYNRDKLSDVAMMPQDLLFPLGTSVEVRLSKKTPWLVRQVGDQKILEKNGKFVTTVDFTSRPQFYGLKTSDGVDMRTVAVVKGRHGFDICNPVWCDNWTGDLGCKYCNMNPSHESDYSSKVLTNKTLNQIGETIAVYHKEVGHFHVVLTSGLPPKGESSYPGMIKIVETMKKYTGLDRIAAVVNIGPPDDFSDIDKAYESGMQSLFHNIEIWDPDMFKAICPGKVRRYGGQEYFKKACDYTAKVFGRGRSFSSMVVGIETKETLLEACKIMADRGTCLNLNPWIPMVNSKMEGHRAPEPEWFMGVYHEAFDIFEKHIPEAVNRDAYFQDTLCPGCFVISCHWDFIRMRLNITEEDGMPYVNGKSPWKGNQAEAA